MAQGRVERRLSKLAAAINQKWRQTGNVGVKISASDLAFILIRDDYRCFYCDTEVEAMGVSFDHVVPFAAGGANIVSNIVACCISCQRSKYTKSPEQLAEWQTLERRCKTCDKAFKPRWADYVRGYGFYCSRKCSGKAAH
jgi:hypothetical protein